MVIIQALGAVAAAALALGTASVLQWPIGFRVAAGIAALVLAVAAFALPRFLKKLAAALQTVAPRAAERLRTTVEAPHSLRTKVAVIAVAGILFFVSIFGCSMSGQNGFPWWLALATLSLAFVFTYFAVKSCPKESRRKILLLAIAGYLVSLSANFVAGALIPAAGVTEATMTALGRKLDGIKEDTEAIRETQADHGVVLEQARDEARATRRLLEEYLEAQKRPGVDPTQQPIPPDVLEAARSLATSKDARERALAAIARRDWAAADQELAALRASPALDEAYQLHSLEGDRFYAEGKFDEAIAPFEAAYNLRPQTLRARNNLAIALTKARRGDRSAQLHRAIELHNGTLEQPDLSKFEWAMTQNNLGNAWLFMPTGDRGSNLAMAIEAHEQALTVYTKPAAPMHWATIQNNLGAAWADLPIGDRGSNLTKAIEAYEQALTVYTKPAAPMHWAMTQNNLGNAWLFMPTGDRGSNLAKAIEAYERALTVRTKAAAPMDWAMTQNNLGLALADLPIGDRGSNLAKAIEAYELALTVRTKAAAPMDWATTQYNLGLALAEVAELPGQDQCALLRRSIAASKGALTVRTPEAFPHDHAETMHNLAIDRQRYESLPCSQPPDGIPFHAIPPAE